VVGRGRRAWWLAAGVAGATVGGVAVWAAINRDLFTWLVDDTHPARKVLEALGFVAGIGAS
jgi:hypothetical protein